MSNHKVTVIIATMAERSRRFSLERALNSIRNQRDISCDICVVVNGTRYDEDLIEKIKSDSAIDYYYSEVASFPEALRIGRSKVKTPFFCFLDDDDELLNNSVKERLDCMLASNTTDVVVGNGYRMTTNGDESKVFSDFNLVSQDPLAYLTRESGNWLASCSGLYRTSSIDQSYFDDYAKHYEWTYLAFKIALKCSIYFIDQPTYRIIGSTGSLSTSESYFSGSIDAVKKIIKLPLPMKHRKKLVNRLSDIHHHLSNRYLQKETRDYMKSWHHHIKSLNSIHGLRYLSYTRHIIKSIV
ncbi:glycosyltransferase family 2 protein [Motiliproteus sediminis]|uniref:glycosyltransferase family A protein n=1 Tax=Motiliproteus sediminis TaxID=1468178 RepID=UPI001AEF588E